MTPWHWAAIGGVLAAMIVVGLLIRRRRDSMTVSILGWLSIAVVVGVSTSTLLLWALGWPNLPRSSEFTTAETLDLLKIALAVVAGFGGVVVLSVNHRKQRFIEKDHALALNQEEREQTKLFNERFAAAAEHLAHERAQVRLAGVYALASLADDWDDGRQKCVDVLMSYLRLSRSESRAPGSGEGEVLDTIFRVFKDRLTNEPAWFAVDFDFTGMKLVDMDFSGFQFDGTVTFDDVTFLGEETLFTGARFAGTLRCNGTKFAATSFRGARFCGEVEFIGARFRNALDLRNAVLQDGTVDFVGCVFDGPVRCEALSAEPGLLRFVRCVFRDAPVDFDYANFGPLFEPGHWYAALLGRTQVLNRGVLHFMSCEMANSPLRLTNVDLEHGRVVVHDLTLRGGYLRITPQDAVRPSLDLRRIDAQDAEVDVPLPERFWRMPSGRATESR